MRQGAAVKANACAGAARFAAAVLARYRLVRPRVPGLDRVGPLERTAVRRPRATSVHLRFHNHLRVTFAPVALIAKAGERPSVLGAAAAVALGDRILRRAIRDDGRETGAPARAEVVPVAMGRAVTALPSIEATSPPVRHLAGHATPPPRALRRPPPAEPPVPTAVTRPAREEARRQVELSGAELDRVTSHVMRTLDRRIHAWRERRGGI